MGIVRRRLPRTDQNRISLNELRRSLKNEDNEGEEKHKDIVLLQSGDEWWMHCCALTVLALLFDCAGGYCTHGIRM